MVVHVCCMWSDVLCPRRIDLYRCMFTNPFVFKLFPYLRVHLVVDLLEVTQAGFPSGGGGRVQAAEEDLPRGRGQEGHLKVLGYGEVWRKLASREHILWREGWGSMVT